LLSKEKTDSVNKFIKQLSVGAQMKRILSYLFLLVFLTSCIEYHEKMKLNSDGSGEVTFAVGVSEDLLKMGGDSGDIKDFNEDKIKKDFEGKKGIKFLGSRTYSGQGNKWIEVKLSFESLEALNNASKDSSSQGMLGESKITKDASGNMVFAKTITSKGKDQKDTTSNAMSNSMMEMMFGKYKWTYEVTLPGKILSSNAASGDIDNATNTVKWTISMASLSKPQILTATFEKQASANLTFIILAVCAVIVLAVVFFFLNKKKKIETIV
jgi:hypothetical protein